MATITPVTASPAGVTVPAAAATAGGDTLAVGITNRTTTLVVKNGSGSAVTVTLGGVRPCSQGSTHSVAVAVAAGAEVHVDVPGQVVDPVTGNVAVTYSASASVTVGAIQR